MLEIKKIEKEDRVYLGMHSYNPLRTIFNVTATCTQDEQRPGEVMSEDYVESVEAGKDYTFRVEVFNRFKKFLTVGEEVTLESLDEKQNIRVLNSDTKMTWDNSF